MKNLSASLLAVLNEIPMGVCLVGRDRRILFINHTLEALTGFSNSQCEGLPCSHVLRFNHCLENCPVNKAHTQGKCALEGDIINQNHQKIPVRVSFSPLKDSSGRVSAYIETVEDLRQVHNFDPSRIHPFSFGGMIGRSEQMEKIFQLLPLVAQSDSPVLITGETGTGKDLLAEAIHQSSSRAKSPFVTFRCGALPEAVVESELFGSEQGSPPEAGGKPGKFRLANNGTLLLSEIGELSPSLQVKLLNYLDEKTIFPRGSARSLTLNVRIIAGSSRDLARMAQEGTFRKELFFRLNAISLHLSPLRERGPDLRLLMDHFLRARASLLNKTVSGFSDQCLRKLEAYDYPGNILELKHIVEYAVNLCQGEQAQLPDLPAYLSEDDGQSEVESSEAAAPGAPDTEGGLDWSAMERRMIMDALMKANGRRNKAAQLLGWGRSTLWRKLKHYGIAVPEDREWSKGA